MTPHTPICESGLVTLFKVSSRYYVCCWKVLHIWLCFTIRYKIFLTCQLNPQLEFYQEEAGATNQFLAFFSQAIENRILCQRWHLLSKETHQKLCFHEIYCSRTSQKDNIVNIFLDALLEEILPIHYTVFMIIVSTLN